MAAPIGNKWPCSLLVGIADVVKMATGRSVMTRDFLCIWSPVFVDLVELMKYTTKVDIHQAAALSQNGMINVSSFARVIHRGRLLL